MPRIEFEESCLVHHEPLKQDIVLILYGLYRYSPAYLEAHRTQFPNSRFYMPGGCMRGEVYSTETTYCEKCRAQHRLWCEKNDVNFGLPLTEIEKEAYIRRMSGNPDFSGTVPEDVNDLIAQGKIVAAIKSLKLANPKVEIQELRCYTRYLQNRYHLKKSG